MTTTYPNRTAPADRRPLATPVAPVSAEKPPYLMAAGVSLGALILYILTLAPTTQFWDTSEYIAAANTLGVPHPPGNPLFVLMAHVWGLLPLAQAYAERINLFAAAPSAGCARSCRRCGRAASPRSPARSSRRPRSPCGISRSSTRRSTR